jgi:exodeoxyribonuclease VIII
MNEREYNAAAGVRRSDLWLINDSPEKFRWHMDHPDDGEPAPAFLFGQAAHKLLLEPMDFTNEFAIKPEGIDRRTTQGKAEWARFQEASQGKGIIDMDAYVQIHDMAEKVMADPMAARLLSGRKELPFFWTDEDSGVGCKVKLDCLTYLDDMPVVVDYKTCKSARTEAFQRDAYQYGYHLQAAMYTEAVMRTQHLTERPMFVFVCQEKEAPYAINIITVPEDVMNYGLDTMRTLLGIYAECEKTGNWWGYSGVTGQPNELALPGWLKKEESKSE